MLCIVTPGLCPPTHTGQLETTSQPQPLLPGIPAASAAGAERGWILPRVCGPGGLSPQVQMVARQARPKEDLILQGAAGPLAPWSQDPQMASRRCSSRLTSNITINRPGSEAAGPLPEEAFNSQPLLPGALCRPRTVWLLKALS